MKAALNYIFKKNFWIILILIILYCGTKVLTIYGIESERKDYKHLKSWVEQCKDLSSEQIDVFVADLSEKIYGTQERENMLVVELSAFVASYHHTQSINRLIDFAKYGEGILPTTLPANYMKMQDFYENLSRPQIIDKSILDYYFELQRYNIVIFVVIFLAAFIWGQHYESGVYKYVNTTPHGKYYYKTVRFLMFAICNIFLIGNEFFDLIYSGLLSDSNILQASIQSYNVFKYAQNDTTIANCLILSLISKFTSTFLICICVELIAKYKQDMKDTIVSSFLIIIVIFMMNQAFRETEAYSMIQMGIVNWRDIVEKSICIIELHLSTLELGCIINCLMAVVVGLYNRNFD